MKACLLILAAAAIAGNGAVAAQRENRPANAIVLFDGSDTSKWDNPWKVVKGAMVSGGGDTRTKQMFDNFQLHLEWREPDMGSAKGQARGNSGVYLQDRYEIQVLDSYGVTEPGMGDCGAVYNQSAPLVNACRPAKAWQTYDIIFRSARFDADGKMISRARVTVIQNGQVVQNNTEIAGPTGGAASNDESKPGALRLQDHGCPVAYRNVWIVPLAASGANHY